ncbi:MAG: hypothetical protein AAFR66_18955 [Bacteroidota bacterium]
MQGKKLILLAVGFIWLASTQAQDLYISKYVGTGHVSDRQHYLEIFNESPQYHRDISGFLLLTRNYALKLPLNTNIGPMQAIRVGYAQSGEKLDVVLHTEQKFFLKRESDPNEEGDFALLINKDWEEVDGFYFSPETEAAFLEEEVELAEWESPESPLPIPGRADDVWNYLRISPDPTFAFVRISDKWKINSRKNSANLLPATKYNSLKATFEEDQILLSWKTLYENDCYQHEIERSQDGTNFRVINSVPAFVNSEDLQSYNFQDVSVNAGETYFYRLSNTDKFGTRIYSEPVRVIASSELSRLSIDLVSLSQFDGKSLDVRFNAAQDQEVRIKILDEEFREIDVLYYGLVRADKQHLIKYQDPLPFGKYYLIADTPLDRSFIEFIIGKNREIIIQE